MNLAYKINNYTGTTDLWVTDQALGQLVLNGNIVEPIVSSRDTALSVNVGDDFDFQDSSHTFTMIDCISQNGDLKTLFNTYNFYGLLVDIKNTSTNVTMQRMTITDYSIGEASITVTLSTYFDELANKEFPGDLIDLDKFPSAPLNSKGQVINHIWNNKVDSSSIGTDPLMNGVKCWRVEYDSTHEYLIGHFYDNLEIDLITYAEDPDGNDVTGSVSLTDATIGGKKYFFIDYNVDVDYLLICFNNENYATAGVETLIDRIGLTLFGSTYTFNLDNLTTVMDGVNRNFDRVNPPGTIANNLTRDVYNLNTTKTGKEILKDICTAYEIEYYINKDNEIIFNYVNYGNISADQTLQPGDILNSTGEVYDYSRIVNQIEINNNWNAIDNHGEDYTIFNNEYSQDKYGVINGEQIDVKFRDGRVTPPGTPVTSLMSFRTAKHRLMRLAYPWIETSIEVTITEGLDRNLLEVLKFKHPKSVNPTADRYFHIRGIDLDFSSDRATLKLRDITYAYDMIDSRLHLKADRQSGTQFYNWGSQCNHWLNDEDQNGATYSTAQTKFRDQSIILDGVDQAVISIPFGTGADAGNFEILNFTNGNFIVGGWIYGVNDATNEVLSSFYKDANNLWVLRKRAGNDFRFNMTVASSSIINMVGGTFVPDTWQFVVAVRVGSDCGLYVDGVQVAYVSSSATDSIGVNQSKLNVGQDGADAFYWDGYSDDNIIEADNKRFTLAPVVGLTDTLTVPTEKLYEFPEGYII